MGEMETTKKPETEFVCVADNLPLTLDSEHNVEIKSEHEDILKIEPGLENNFETDMEKSFELDKSFETEVSTFKLESNSDCDKCDYENQDKGSESDTREYSNENKIPSDEDAILISNIEIKQEEDCFDYEFLQDTPKSSPIEMKKPKPKPDRKINGWKKKQLDNIDDDYIPPQWLATKESNKQNTTITNKMCPEPSIKSRPEPEVTYSEYTMTIELDKYKRTTRIGRCIFNHCREDCVSYVPRTVRRRMIMECNMYIPPLSEVCAEHLRDQNWEDLLPDTMPNFTGYQCQDMKNIIMQACRTNFDFEYIETVDSKLVRYWFDLNKGDFNRIFTYYPKLKRLKKPKTAFAVYLMHLQNTSVKRICLLLQMNEKTVKKRINIVKDLVKCNSYIEFKDMFLEDD